MFYQEQLDNSSSFQAKIKETVNHLCKQRQSLNVWAAAQGFSVVDQMTLLIAVSVSLKICAINIYIFKSFFQLLLNGCAKWFSNVKGGYSCGFAFLKIKEIYTV